MSLVYTSLINDPSLEAYYRFESGSDTVDSSSNSNTLTHGNTPTNTTGRFGNAMLYNNPDDEHSVAADSASLDITGDISFSLWMNWQTLPSVVPEIGCLISKFNTSGQKAYRIEVLDSGDVLNVKYSGDGTNETDVSSSSAIIVGGDINTWIHLAVTIDVSAQDIKVYKNNAAVALGAVTGTQSSIFNSSESLGIACSHAGSSPQRFPNATLDDVAIFSRVLTPGEISDIFRGSSAGVGVHLTL